MIISAYEPSLLNIYTAKSIHEVIKKKFNTVSEGEIDFLFMVLKLREQKNTNKVTSEDLAQEIVVDENLLISYARKWKSCNVLYIEKYRPEYVCKIKDDFIADIDTINPLEYTDFTNRIIFTYNKNKATFPTNKELAYLYSLKSDMQVSDGVFIEILEGFLKADSSLKASDISSLIDYNASWGSILEVKNLMSKLADEYSFVYKLMKSQGYKSKPTIKELGMYRKWVYEWNFTDQEIMDINRTLTDGDYPMEYLDGALYNIHKQQLSDDLKKSREEMETLKKIIYIIKSRYITEKAISIYINLRSEYEKEFIALAAEYAIKINSNNDKWYQIEKLLKEWKKQNLNSETDIGIYEGKKEGVLPF